MAYPLHELNDTKFEELIVLICEKILGEGTINFAEGKDGGKDARFHGKANSYPSESAPWIGKIIVQAKHTQKVDASCSDSDFQTILKKELPKIQKLKANNEIDYYMLFTNRKLTGVQDSKIEKLISEKPGVVNSVIGLEKIQLWLKKYPVIARTAQLNRLLLPLQFDEQDLKELIVSFRDNLPSKSDISKRVSDMSYTEMQTKNELNQLSKDYFDEQFKKQYEYFQQIDDFLSDPRNRDLKEAYLNTVDDLNAKIIIARDDYFRFEEILEYLYNYVDQNNSDLHRLRRLIRTFLIYMYCKCDIGKKS